MGREDEGRTLRHAQPDDLFWTPADWAWIGGLFDVLMPAWHHGVPVLAHRFAKFDPHEAVELWKRMAKASEGRQPPEFASTHPNTGRRIQDIEGWIPEAMPLFEAKDSKDTLRRLPAPL